CLFSTAFFVSFSSFFLYGYRYHRVLHSFPTRRSSDLNYLRLVERALRPELAGALRIGVASHNLYDVALAHLLAERRGVGAMLDRSEEHTSELQSRENLVCRLLLEKKKKHI